MTLPSYYSRHREKCLEYRKRYYATRVEKMRSYNQKYYLANRDKILARFHERYYKAHPRPKLEAFPLPDPDFKPSPDFKDFDSVRKLILFKLSLDESKSKKKIRNFHPERFLSPIKDAELVDSISIQFD